MIKIVILYRVIQEWRAPVFDKLNVIEDINIEVWHGPDFKGTKVISTKKQYSFVRRKLVSIKVRLKSTNGTIALPFSPFLFFSLLKKNPEVVICEGASNILNSLIAFVYCKIFKKKYIWWSLGKLQNRKYDVKRSKIDILIQYIERRSHAIITYSTIGENYFKSIGVKPEKIFKAVNVIDTDRALQLIESKLDLLELKDHYRGKYDFISLFVGALTEEKSIEILLQAQKLIENNYPKAGLIIVGDGNYRQILEDLALSLNIKNVEFVGKKIDDNYKYFSIADVFILPGLGGLAISEAMCYGLPVITSIADGCEVDLVTNKNGIIDLTITPQSLAEHIAFFINNDDIRKEYGNHSLSIIENRYHINNYLRKINDAIHS
jgi:glycosyltransferase involved in cell wall biosynthesis